MRQSFFRKLLCDKLPLFALSILTIGELAKILDFCLSGYKKPSPACQARIARRGILANCNL